MLYDDDVKRSIEEKDGNKGSDKIKLGPKGGNDYKFLNYREVQNNKVVISITLGGIMAQMIEEDKTIELFFACSYDGQNTELLIAFSDYLKVKEKEPLIVYVCGYWNKNMPYAGTEWGKDYWGDSLKNSAKKYFYNTTKELFINGAGEKGDGGGKRFEMGKKMAEDRFANSKSKFHKEVFEKRRKVMIVSHSMGSAFAEGMISVMNQKGVNIEKVVHLSPADVSGFSATLPKRTFQIDIDWDPVLMYKNFDDAPNIVGVNFSGTAKNPAGDEFGHMYTKEKDYVWHWFEDLELINFQFIDEENKIYTTPSGGIGYGGTSYTVLRKNYSAVDLKYNSIFLKIKKNSKLFFYDDKNEKYYTED